MRLAMTALLLAATALTACSGKTTGTGTGSLPGAPPPQGAVVDNAGDCAAVPPATCDTSPSGGAKKTTPTPTVYDPLFAYTSADTSTTPDSITGLWSGAATFGNDDVRLLITSSEITIALRCKDTSGPAVTVGLTVNAVVSSTGIRVLDSKSAGTSPCQIVVRPQSMDRCSTGSGSLSCFDMDGTGLDFHTAELFTGIGSLDEAPAPRFEKLNNGP